LIPSPACGARVGLSRSSVNYSPTATSINQQYAQDLQLPLADGSIYTSNLKNTVAPSATPTSASGLQRYIFKDSGGSCYDRTINESRGLVKSVKDNSRPRPRKAVQFSSAWTACAPA
jgi:hypothetical protein